MKKAHLLQFTFSFTLVNGLNDESELLKAFLYTPEWEHTHIQDPSLSNHGGTYLDILTSYPHSSIVYIESTQ